MNTEIKNKKKIAVWAVTKSGYQHGLNLASNIDGSVLFLSEKLIKKLKGLKTLNKSFCNNPRVFSKLSESLKDVFKEFDGHIFIFSTGIAVRIIAPLIKSKVEDPAIVVMDDRAIHAVSLLSGHIGGANDLAKKVGLITKAKPVITTATDIHGQVAIDVIATENNVHIVNPDMIKKINMAILEEEKIAIHDPFNIFLQKIPNSILTGMPTAIPATAQDNLSTSKLGSRHTKEANSAIETKNPDIICTDIKIHVPRGTLVLNPPSLVVGLGCNRGTSINEIEKFFLKTLKQNKLSLKSIWAFASIDAKHDEQGFLELSKKYKIQFLFINKEKINLEKNIKNPSKTVEKHMGVKSVCEAAAIIAGKNAKLIVQKQIKGNMTIAITRQSQCFI
ncbi:MAG: cobalamin biosynthesis protein [Desulfobacteraceae bacterium]|nr:cobalamin biosynthesis protein [Desulfobacteraceae bacterium]